MERQKLLQKLKLLPELKRHQLVYPLKPDQLLGFYLPKQFYPCQLQNLSSRLQLLAEWYALIHVPEKFPLVEWPNLFFFDKNKYPFFGKTQPGHSTRENFAGT